MSVRTRYGVSDTLPTPPVGTYWEITGTPEGPWTWESGTVWHEGRDGVACLVEFYANGIARGATAVWRH